MTPILFEMIAKTNLNFKVIEGKGMRGEGGAGMELEKGRCGGVDVLNLEQCLSHKATKNGLLN